MSISSYHTFIERRDRNGNFHFNSKHWHLPMLPPSTQYYTHTFVMVAINQPTIEHQIFSNGLMMVTKCATQEARSPNFLLLCSVCTIHHSPITQWYCLPPLLSYLQMMMMMNMDNKCIHTNNRNEWEMFAIIILICNGAQI